MSDAGWDEARDELRELVTLLRTHLEWHLDVGSVGFPRAPREVTARGVPRVSAPSNPVSVPGQVLQRERSRSGVVASPPPRSESAPPVLPPSEKVASPPPRSEPAPPVLPPSEKVVSPPPRSEPPPVPPRSETTSGSGLRISAVEAPIAQPRPTLEGARLEAAHARLEVVCDRVAACTACRLHETRTNTVFARGQGSSGLCFVGEGPGADEDAQGVPFVGAAGQLLDRMIVAMGMTRDEVYVCNIVKCRPPKNRKPAPDEMLACRDYLEEQIAILDPVVIVALGATAVQGLLGATEGITRMRGRWRLYQGRIAVMPTFHPAYLLRNPAAKREVWEDLQAVLRQMGRPIPERSR